MDDINSQIKEIQQKFKIIGRTKELKKIFLAFNSRKNVLIEGEIGTSKTTLARAFASYMNKDFFRIDGSEDILSHVLVGYFDPPMVVAKGYKEEAFIYGPLSESMKNGGILFINELNRLPESTQNVLLSALDEGYLTIPKLGSINSNKGFMVITTMNPAAHVGVTSLGEALLDRFVWIKVDFQPLSEEIEIIKINLEELIESQGFKITEVLIEKTSQISAKIINLTRYDEDLRRGASIRAGIDLGSIVIAYSATEKSINSNESFWFTAANMALSTKIELEDGVDKSKEEVINDIVAAVLKDFQ
jgi:MoxR-like ATPase